MQFAVRCAVCLACALLCEGLAWNGKASTDGNEGRNNNIKHLRSSTRRWNDANEGQRHKVHVKSVSASEVGIVHKTEYWGKIFVGSPRKEFTVIFDTGSGNLILPSNACTEIACTSHRRYDPKDSNTSAQVGDHGKSLTEAPKQQSETTINFGTGSIHGQFYQDHLCLSQGAACYKANFIGTDYESDMPFETCAFDGIMGLGFKDLSMGAGFNMIDDVVSQHALPHNQFSVYLRDHETGSEITFGGYKKSRVASDVLWAPVTQQSYWQIGIADLTFNNAKTGLCTKCQVAVDTGTSMMAGPTDVIERLSEKLAVQLDCSNFHKLPLLGFQLGDKVLNILPDDYIDRAVLPTREICSLNLMAIDVPPPKGPLFIFGDPFLRRFVTIYDRDGPRVGFAVAQHEGTASTDAKKFIATVPGAKPEADATTDESDEDGDGDGEGLLQKDANFDQATMRKAAHSEDGLVTISLARIHKHH